MQDLTSMPGPASTVIAASYLRWWFSMATTGDTLQPAVSAAYKSVQSVDFDNIFCRGHS